VGYLVEVVVDVLKDMEEVTSCLQKMPYEEGYDDLRRIHPAEK